MVQLERYHDLFYSGWSWDRGQSCSWAAEICGLKPRWTLHWKQWLFFSTRSSNCVPGSLNRRKLGKWKAEISSALHIPRSLHSQTVTITAPSSVSHTTMETLIVHFKLNWLFYHSSKLHEFVVCIWKFKWFNKINAYILHMLDI